MGNNTKFMKKVVVFCISAAIIYTAIAIVYQIIKGNEISPTLTQFFIGGMIGELSATALIKIGEGLVESIRAKYMKDEMMMYQAQNYGSGNGFNNDNNIDTSNGFEQGGGE